MSRPDDPRIPLNSIVFGFGPMLPLAAAALGAWLLPPPWPVLAVRLAIIWGALILVFVAGVRRGFGFGNPRASTAVEIATMLAYFVPAGLALVVPSVRVALALLLLGYVLVPTLDTRAARAGNAPAHFARLRWPQMAIALVSIVALMLFVLRG
ncbi:DUF3429 family protein [Sphingomonas abaci]|uniref:Uncharacterized membrane protein YjgN (DUF898 family) n=1 Tax=Sphingomonas abaci TaxID=237611 RepID=A0A7W7EWF1_9SPHN|nr:DUF3429 family protein [Sphingomonas abaci]MBB4616472.1 uncharacterized membrane protein YjgN (DUF898 family) [Sphingomonas abaci]